MLQHPMPAVSAMAVWLLALTFVGCGDDDGPVCLVGESRACTGPGGCSGAQVCLPDGMSLGPCECGTAPDGGPDDGGRTDSGPGVADGGDEDGGEEDAFTPRTHLFPARDFVCEPAEAPLCSTTVAALTDAERTRELGEDELNLTAAYVVRVWRFDPEGSAAAPGYNLDLLSSGSGDEGTTCEERSTDVTSSLDPAHVGVDNALVGLVPTLEGIMDRDECPGGDSSGCLDASIAEAIATGLLLVVEITDLDSYEYDPTVEITLHLAMTAAGAEPILGGDGLLVPGQDLRSTATLIGPVSGDVFAGRLRVQLPSFDIPDAVVPSQLLIDLPVADAELRFDIAAGSLSRGNMGGAFLTEDLTQRLAADDPSTEETIRSVLENVSDLTPSAGDAGICERISVGWELEAVPATLVP